MKEKYCKLIKKTIKALDNNDVCTREMRETAIQAMKEVQQYREIGTPEECRKAAKKQTAKKIEIFNGQASCPNCKHLFGGMDVIKKLTTWDMPYCKDCGQKLDWGDKE